MGSEASVQASKWALLLTPSVASGFRRRRVRVKQPLLRRRSDSRPIASSPRRFPTGNASTPGMPGPAPLLSPGAYDAEELLRHRARSASSGSQAEAAEEWTRTGGTFARVSTVRAREAAAAAASAAAAAAETRKEGGGQSASFSAGESSNPVSPPDSPRSLFARTKGIGVEGALGYFDTDAEDSGAESGSNSPVVMRSTGRRGLKSDKLGFTPMEGTAATKQQAAVAADLEDQNVLNVSLSGTAAEGSSRGSGATSPYSFVGGSNERSPTFGADSNSSWIGVEAAPALDKDAFMAAAADLEPFHSASSSAQ